MVRDSALRAKKYELKQDSTAIASRFSAQKDQMVSQQNQRTAEAVVVENSVKNIVELAGVSPHEIPAYLAFGKQVDKVSRTFNSKETTSTGGKKVQDLATMWKSRGLTNANLIAIASAQGYTVTLPT